MAISEHVLSISTFVARPRAEVFSFFSDAENLERITPTQLRFQMTTPTPVRMGKGTLIDYRLRLFGVPFRWRTRISVWNPPSSFVDEQLSGPYAKWVHTHSFQEAGGGTAVTDSVRYRLPVFPLGELALPFVRLQLKYIFTYRAERIKELLG
jgi:ligand-binding SRPBCC domain-containing protein